MTNKKEALISEVTQAIMKSLGAPQQSVRVIISEMPKQHFGIGGESAKKTGALTPHLPHGTKLHST